MKYHNHKLQTNPWYREEDPHNNHKTKQSNQPPLKVDKMLNGFAPLNMRVARVLDKKII